jgi:hypothetical protein
MNAIGRWNVEITFAKEEHRSVRFDAQADGKGTLMPADPQAKVWGAATPSEAKWTRKRRKLDHFLGSGGIYARQRRAGRRNVGVQGKI